MARSATQHAESLVGSMALRIAELQARVEALEEENAALRKAAEASDP